MPKSLTACISDAKKQATYNNYKTKNIKNYNYNKPTRLEASHSKPTTPKQPERRYSGRKLFELINTDPTFKIGLTWGMHGGLLYELCQSHGVETVKRSIDFVSKLPAAKRNGRYCRTVILNGGPQPRR